MSRSSGAAVGHGRHVAGGAGAGAPADHGREVPYYLLADTREGQRKEQELTGKTPLNGEPQGDVHKGFVYQRVPHITLKSIANNPDIREGMSREEIDAAIKRHSESELLYDKPYEDKQKIRVANPVHGREPVPAQDDRPEAAGERGGR